MDYQLLYKIMDQKYPLKNRDCGKLCEKACCSNENSETGMFLFPEEEKLYKTGEWFRIEELTTRDAHIYPYDETKVYKLICNGTCDREKRPLACRLFPTYPKLHDNGVFNMVYDIQSFMLCPLAKSYDFKKLNRDFISSARKVWKHLLEDKRNFDRYLHEAKQYDETLNDPWFKLLRT